MDHLAQRLPGLSRYSRCCRSAGPGRPPLDRFASRAYVGGVVPNRPQNLVAWILNPPRIDPLTAMPASGVSEPEGRDIAAYLYTLR